MLAQPRGNEEDARCGFRLSSSPRGVRARLCISVNTTGAPAVECKLVVGIIVQLTRREAIILVFVILFIWFTGYLTGAKVTRISEKI